MSVSLFDPGSEVCKLKVFVDMTLTFTLIEVSQMKPSVDLLLVVTFKMRCIR